MNDHPFHSDEYDITWQEVQALKNHNIKVMAMLGGSAGGTYKYFNGSEEEVLSPFLFATKEMLIMYGSSTHTTTP